MIKKLIIFYKTFDGMLPSVCFVQNLRKDPTPRSRNTRFSYKHGFSRCNKEQRGHARQNCFDV